MFHNFQINHISNAGRVKCVSLYFVCWPRPDVYPSVIFSYNYNLPLQPVELTYKAQSLGKRVVTVKPYLTSQLDHRGLDGGARKGCRYIGSDGTVMDADVNAAINILHKYDPKHPVSCYALDGQVSVSTPCDAVRNYNVKADPSLVGR